MAPPFEHRREVHDAAGRVIASVDALGYRTTSLLDATGNLLASVDPLGNRVSAVYDPTGANALSAAHGRHNEVEPTALTAPGEQCFFTLGRERAQPREGRPDIRLGIALRPSIQTLRPNSGPLWGRRYREARDGTSDQSSGSS